MAFLLVLYILKEFRFPVHSGRDGIHRIIFRCISVYFLVENFDFRIRRLDVIPAGYKCNDVKCCNASFRVRLKTWIGRFYMIFSRKHFLYSTLLIELKQPESRFAQKDSQH